MAIHGVTFPHIVYDTLAPSDMTFVVRVFVHELLECQVECGEEGTIVAIHVGLDYQDR